MEAALAWEVLAIWAIVIAIIIWFVRDERRLAWNRIEAQARHFAVHPPARRIAED